MRFSPFCKLIFCASVLAACATATVAQEGGPSGGASAEGPLQFRRVYAPADRVQDWPRGNARYVPVEAAEFERLLERAQSAGSIAPPAAALLEAVYEAELVDGDDLRGTLTWDIGVSGDTPVVVPLPQMNLALSAALPDIEKPDDAEAQDAPVAGPAAVVGAGERGLAALRVAHAGKFTSRFTLAGRRDIDGQIVIPFEIPPCAVSKLLLTLPQGTTPSVSAGMITEQTEHEGKKTYEILLSGQGSFTLRLAAADGESPRRFVVGRESSVCEVSPRGLDIACMWKLDVHTAPIRQLTLALDPGLELVAARLGETDVPFKTMREAPEATATVVLDLPESLSGGDRTLSLSAIGPAVIGNSWRLPRIHAPDVLWQEGTATLLVREPLSVGDLVTHDCRQTKSSVLPEPNRGESFEVQLFSDKAAVEVMLQRRQAPVELASLTNVELSAGKAAAEITAAVQLSAGHRSAIVADITPGWIVDAVDVVPHDQLGSWRVDGQAELPRLTVSFAPTIDAEAPVKLRVRCRRITAEDVSIYTAADFAVLHFREVKHEDRFLRIRAAESFGVRLADLKDLPRLERRPTSSVGQELFAIWPTDPVYRFDAERSRFAAIVEPKPPQFSAALHGEVTVTRENLTETYTIRCAASTRPVTRVLAEFYPAQPEPWKWRVVGNGATAVAARPQPEGEPDDQHVAVPGERWELTVIGGTTAPFEIVAERERTRDEQATICLATLPDATTQSGRLVIRAAADVPIELQTSGVVPVDEPSSEANSTRRAAYEYSPADAMRSRVTIAGGAHLLAPAAEALVWSRHIESSYGADGRALHMATLRITNAGRSRITLSAPAGADLRRVWLDGSEQRPDRPTQTSVPLPPRKEHVLVVVEYASTNSVMGTHRQLAAPVIDVDVPVMSTDWLCSLPEGFEILKVDGGSSEPHSAGVNWSQRLLGPFGRGPAAERMDLLTAGGWERFIDRRRDLTRSRSTDFLVQLDEIAADLEQNSDRPVDWRRMLTAADSIAREIGLTLLVDPRGLERARIAPRSLVRDARYAALGSAPGLITNSSLVLLATPDAVVLTDMTAAEVARAQISWVVPDVLATVTTGTLRTAIAAAATGAESAYVTSAVWSTGALDPWGEAVFHGPQSLEGAGGLPYLVHFDSEGPVIIQLSRAATVTTMAAGTALIAAALCLGFVRSKWRLLGIAVLAAAVALIAPASVSFLATGFLWGAAAALLWRQFGPRIMVVPQREMPSASGSMIRIRTSTTSASSAIVVIAALSALALAAQGQVPEAATRAETTSGVYRVFIPVDEDEKPTGDKYQVPEPLYDELVRRKSERPAAAQDWMLRSARYQTAIVRDLVSDTLQAGDVTVDYQLVTLSRGCVVRLPLAGVRPTPTLRLDGAPIELDWGTDEDGFFARFDAPGNYQLEISTRPQRGERTPALLDMTIPPVPQATLEVTLPVGSPSVEVPSARGAAELSADGRKMVVDLGATSQLALFSGRARAARPAAAQGDADLRFLLQVQPASVVLHAHIDLRSLKTPLAQLWLSIDPRLRPLPIADRAGMVLSAQSQPGDPQTVRIDLARPLVDHGTIPVSFLLTGSSGIGQLALPRIVPQGVTVGEQELGVAIDPALQYEPAAPEPQAALAVADFLASFGGTTTSPQFALRLSADEEWSIHTRPREPTMNVKERVALRLDEGQARVRYDATLVPIEAATAPTGYVLEYRLDVPAELEVDRVSLVHDDVEQVSRYARPLPERLTLFLTGPVSGRQQLSLEGRLPTPLDGTWELPRIRVDAGARHETNVLIFRHPAVNATVEDRHGLIETERPRAPQPALLPVRLVAALAAPTEDFSATVRISPNRPRIRSSQLMSVTTKGETWEGRIEYRATVSEGRLDEIVWTVPSAWTGPFEVTPAAIVEIVDEASQPRRIILRPVAAIEGECQFGLRTPVRMVEGERLTLPALVPLRDEVSVAYATLPATIGNERVRWTTHGLTTEQIPDDGGVVAPQGATSFRVRETPATAEWRLSRNAADGAGTTADIRMAWSFNRPAHGVATFVVPNSDVSEGRLALPPGVQVVELRCDDALITPSAEAGEWRIPFERGRERQVVRVVFTSDPPQPTWDGNFALVAPALRVPEVKRTDWHIRGPASSGRIDLGAGARDALLASSTRPLEIEDTTTAAFDGPSTEQWSFAGAAPVLALHRGAGGAAFWFGRVLAAAALTGLVALFVRASRRRSLPTFAAHPLAVAGIVVGLVLAAWISPAWIGAIILLVSTLVAVGPESIRGMIDGIRATREHRGI